MKRSRMNSTAPSGRETNKEIEVVPGPPRRSTTPGALRKQKVKDFLESVMPRGRGIPVLPADSAQTEEMDRRERRQVAKAARRRASA